jgi:ribosomal protein L23
MTMILRHPVSTEKAIRMMEAENKLIFVVEKSANKKIIAHAFEKYFKIKPIKVNTLVRSDGIKRAIITLPADKPAIDIATNLGML